MNLCECMACHAPMLPDLPVLKEDGYLLCDVCADRLSSNGMLLTGRNPGRVAPPSPVTAPTVHCLCGTAVESASTRAHSGEQQLCDKCALLRLAENLASKRSPSHSTSKRFGMLDRLEMLDLDLAEMAVDAVDSRCKPETIKALIAALSKTHHAYQNEIRDRSHT